MCSVHPPRHVLPTRSHLLFDERLHSLSGRRGGPAVRDQGPGRARTGRLRGPPVRLRRLPGPRRALPGRAAGADQPRPAGDADRRRQRRRAAPGRRHAALPWWALGDRGQRSSLVAAVGGLVAPARPATPGPGGRPSSVPSLARRARGESGRRQQYERAPRCRARDGDAAAVPVAHDARRRRRRVSPPPCRPTRRADWPVASRELAASTRPKPASTRALPTSCAATRSAAVAALDAVRASGQQPYARESLFYLGKAALQRGDVASARDLVHRPPATPAPARPAKRRGCSPRWPNSRARLAGHDDRPALSSPASASARDPWASSAPGPIRCVHGTPTAM